MTSKKAKYLGKSLVFMAAIELQQFRQSNMEVVQR